MDQITIVERELLELGVPANMDAEELRRLAKDVLWQALELDSVHALKAPLASIQTAYEVPYSAEDCERAAGVIWNMAHDA
ncbi:hypothetical protein [Methyloferula stellata]|uniref:hypothetical protein n=1 Tax=Methyloferula stellata TaxID=876270 RepID=UPI0003727BBD|nr:hypothetical protein [Methyloferula stellata]